MSKGIGKNMIKGVSIQLRGGRGQQLVGALGFLNCDRDVEKIYFLRH